MPKKPPEVDPSLPWDGMPVYLFPLDKLIPYARNSKLHPPEQVAKIAASLKEFGWVRPILINKRTDLGIRAGHGTVLGAARLWEAGQTIVSAFNGKPIPDRMVPCIAAEHLSTTQIQAYVIADNRLAEGADWDRPMLSLELRELKANDFDLGLTGLELPELEELLVEAVESGFPTLPSGERDPFQQMTFTLHDDQVDLVKRAVAKAKEAGEFKGPNANSNGNALARICAAYLMEEQES